MKRYIGLISAAIIFAPALFAKGADLVFLNGIIETPTKRAEAVAIKDDRIIAVGSSEAIKAHIDASTKTVDLKGRLLAPGFIEGHGHLSGLGEKSMRLDVTGKSPEEIRQLVAKATQKRAKGQWILGRGWDQNLWETKEFPDASILKGVAPEHPVVLTRVDGHAIWVNSSALRLAGVSKQTTIPKGGRALRDKKGELTGVFIDTAMSLVRSKIPAMTPKQKRQAIEQAVQTSLRHGVTSFHDAGVPREELDIYQEMAKEGALKIRVYAMLQGGDFELLREYFRRGPIRIGDVLDIRSVKLVADGALGSRGAALLEDYSDEPGHRGLALMTEDEIFRVTKRALESGYQVATHAIGDKANRVVLDAYERAIKAARVSDHRLRVEHAQILDEKDIPRFGQLDVIASVQGIHCTSDMPWVPARLGDARTKEGAYPWRAFQKGGALVVNGSDAPVEPVDPLLGFYASVTRMDSSGSPKGGWLPEQRLTRRDAFLTYTQNAAFAAFREKDLGSIEVGKKADLVVLSRDIMKIAAPDILKTKVDMTIFDGEIVYSRQPEKNMKLLH